MHKIILITKDALNRHSLPVYGNEFWNTPNIDELASKGTVFNRHYTAGGSTAMAFTSMALGKYCYETGRKDYSSEKSMNGKTIFDTLYRDGYNCHIIWDSTYQPFANKHFLCEGEHTVIHNMSGIKQQATVHKKGEFDDISWNDEETNLAIEMIENELIAINNSEKSDCFVWMHLPHVMRGRQGYGSDIDVFDKIIGIARRIFGDDDIFISADHGHMNGWKNKYHYGFDVGEELIRIPLIAPKITNLSTVDFPTSTIQMYDILKNRVVTRLDYVISETSYYAQPKRKIAIIKNNYKYIFDKEGKKEYLYDLDFDKEENHNLVFPEFYDIDRYLWYSTAQCFYYPRWKESSTALHELRKMKDSVWRNGTVIDEFIGGVMHKVRCFLKKIKMYKPSKEIRNIGK